MDAPVIEKKKAGRPKKEVIEEEEVVVGSPTPGLIEPVELSQMVEIKHVFRVISISGLFVEGYDVHPANVIEDHINQNYLAQGYVLFDVKPIRIVVSKEEVPIGHEVLYVLVKYAE